MVKKARVAPSDTERFADFEILPINYLCFLASLFSCYPTIFGFLFFFLFQQGILVRPSPFQPMHMT